MFFFVASQSSDFNVIKTTLNVYNYHGPYNETFLEFPCDSCIV